MQSNGLVPAPAFEASPEFGNRARSVRGPDHARLLKTCSDDMFAATFNGAGAAPRGHPANHLRDRGHSACGVGGCENK